MLSNLCNVEPLVLVRLDQQLQIIRHEYQVSYIAIDVDS